MNDYVDSPAGAELRRVEPREVDVRRAREVYALTEEQFAAALVPWLVANGVSVPEGARVRIITERYSGGCVLYVEEPALDDELLRQIHALAGVPVTCGDEAPEGSPS